MNEPLTQFQQKLVRGMTLPEYDHKLATLRKLSAELGLPVMPDLHIGIKVTDRNGKVLEDRYEQGHSWTRNAWTAFNCAMMDSPSNAAAFSTLDSSFRRGYLSVRALTGGIAGSLTSPPFFRSASYTTGGFQGQLSSAGSGILVGTSTEPFSGEDFCLWGMVAQGTGAGQMSYQAQPTPTVAWDNSAATYTTTYSRVFNNNSPGSITINEVGMAEANGYLMSRDVLASPVSVPVGGQLTITVSITTTSFAALESSCAVYPAAAGASYGGGIFIGWCQPWNSSNTNGGITNGHTKYALILSPKTGGEVASKQFYNSGGSFTINPNDASYGKNNSDALVAAGAASSLGQHCSTQNAANLGGYNDWYIPSYAELTAVFQRFASIPSGEQPSNANYWTSSWATTTTAYVLNPATGAGPSGLATNTSLTARLVRRVKL